MSHICKRNHVKNPFVSEDVSLIKQGRYIFSGSLLLADISGFTELTEKLARHGKKGTEDLTDLLNRYFDAMFNIVREFKGSVISSAGDSVLVRFPPDGTPYVCAKKMMTAMSGFRNIETDAGVCRLVIKIVIGSGTWNEFIVGDRNNAHVFLSGDLIEKMSEKENKARSGEIVIVESEFIPENDDYRLPDILETSFMRPGSDKTYGEHRSIVALFLDFRGYNKNNPQFEQLQQFYLDISGIACKYKGSVQLVDNILSVGSRIFLLFGAPLSSGNEAANAVGASLEIQEILMNQDLLEGASGINEGYAFAGVIGNDWSKQYTVIGDVVNTAARLADSTAMGDITVSEGVYRITREMFEFRELECISVKGKSEPVKRFAPFRRKRKFRDRYPFVGRTDELSDILNAIRKKNTLIELTGEAGIGKTSLLHELSRKLKKSGYSVLHGTCAEQGQVNHLFSSLLKTLSGINEDDPRETKKDKLRELLHTLESDASSDLSKREVFLGRMLFSLDYPPSTYDVLPPKLRRENLLDGMCKVIQAYNDPVCVIFEDIHYSEDEEHEAIKYIARLLLKRSDRKISFILSKRPDGRIFSLEDNIPLHRIQLEGLEISDSEKLMTEILNGVSLDEDIEQLINRRAEGNPFYLTQFLLYLMENDLIRKSGNSWIKTESYSDDKLPGNVFSMVMARIDRLEEEARECLSIGSVIGFTFEEEIVQRVIEKDIHKNLEVCSEAGLTYLSKLHELEYIFSHMLIKDVVYDSILRKRRRKIHGKIGSILEEIHSERVGDFSTILAYHFNLSKNWEKALQYSIIAGAQAWSEYRNQNSIEHYTRAIRILQDEFEGRSEELAGCHFHLAEVLDRLGDYDKALENYSRTMELSSDISLQGSAGISIADIFYTRGEIDLALDLLDKVEGKLDMDLYEHRVLEVRIESFRAWTYCVKGNIDSAMKKAERAVSMAENLSLKNEKIMAHRIGHAHNTIATVHWANAEYGKAREHYFKALNIARKHGLKREVAVTFGNIGLVSEKMGRFEEAIDSYSKQLTFSSEIGDKLIILSSYGELSVSYCATGQFSKALENAQKYRILAGKLPSLHDILLSYTHLSMIHLRMGCFDKAFKYAEIAYERSKNSAFDREESMSLYLLGRISFKREDFKNAEKYLIRADDLARKVHAKSLLQEILICLAELKLHYRKIGECKQLLNEAYNLIEDKEMDIGKALVSLVYGKLYAASDDYENSMTAFEKALMVFEDFNVRPDLAETYQAYAEMLLSGQDITEKDRKKAEKYFLLVKELYEFMKLPEDTDRTG